jgi:hypothetical protein
VTDHGQRDEDAEDESAHVREEGDTPPEPGLSSPKFASMSW